MIHQQYSTTEYINGFTLKIAKLATIIKSNNFALKIAKVRILKSKNENLIDQSKTQTK